LLKKKCETCGKAV